MAYERNFWVVICAGSKLMYWLFRFGNGITLRDQIDYDEIMNGLHQVIRFHVKTKNIN